MPAHRPICFGYMPKTNQITGKAYQTSLDSKIEGLRPCSTCQSQTKNGILSATAHPKFVFKLYFIAVKYANDLATIT